MAFFPACGSAVFPQPLKQKEWMTVRQRDWKPNNWFRQTSLKSQTLHEQVLSIATIHAQYNLLVFNATTSDLNLESPSKMSLDTQTV
jgi:hypothetical protein